MVHAVSSQEDSRDFVFRALEYLLRKELLDHRTYASAVINMLTGRLFRLAE